MKDFLGLMFITALVSLKYSVVICFLIGLGWGFYVIVLPALPSAAITIFIMTFISVFICLFMGGVLKK